MERKRSRSVGRSVPWNEEDGGEHRERRREKNREKTKVKEIHFLKETENEKLKKWLESKEEEMKKLKRKQKEEKKKEKEKEMKAEEDKKKKKEESDEKVRSWLDKKKTNNKNNKTIKNNNNNHLDNHLTSHNEHPIKQALIDDDINGACHSTTNEVAEDKVILTSREEIVQLKDISSFNKEIQQGNSNEYEETESMKIDTEIKNVKKSENNDHKSPDVASKEDSKNNLNDPTNQPLVETAIIKDDDGNVFIKNLLDKFKKETLVEQTTSPSPNIVYTKNISNHNSKNNSESNNNDNEANEDENNDDVAKKREETMKKSVKFSVDSDNAYKPSWLLD